LKKQSRQSKASFRLTAVLPLAGHGQPILTGAVKELKKRRLSWSLRPVEPGRGIVVDELEEWSPDAALIQVGHKRATQWCRERGIPYVLILGNSEENAPHALTASLDDRAVGRMAAEYFLSRAFKHYGFVGNENFSFSHERQAGFTGVLHAHGCSAESYVHQTPEFASTGERRVIYHQAFGDWLRNLSKPVAVLASNDVEALSLTQAASEAGLKVPDDVAILGAGDDPLFCNLSVPDISSIKLPFSRLGSQAMSLLIDALYNRKSDTANVVLGPVTSVSSNIQQITDPEVAKAMQYFVRHIDEPVKVKDLLRELGTSRANLERRFKAEFGHTPLVELRRLRIERAQRLLADTNLTNAEIARRSGFTSNIRFVTVFKELVGTPPAQYRDNLRVEIV